ncbi:U-box domain-containing protein 9-like [Hibiscus syriacus]|uniref:U-box domain-containing protein 9-like n=1 Tax=Hibiscus syriacus TaxID=106335 RepID=UPI0019220465|nr:U-box domain-containing protein 9-like [Hibiscus syriacus]
MAESGESSCPHTQQVLSHTILTPNLLINEMISQWCDNQGIELQIPVQHGVEGISCPPQRPHLKEAAKEMRLLMKNTPSFRALFGESINPIPRLFAPLLGSKSQSGVLHTDIQENVITIMLNLSIHDGNKKLVAERPMAITLLMEGLRYGTIETRSNAVAALFTLSALESNKELIGKSGALNPLIELLDEGHTLALKDVASAIFNRILDRKAVTG